jgi:large subunit ribosomal protein L19
MAQYLKIKEMDVAVGDTIKVFEEIIENDKKRVQTYQGIIISIKNCEVNKSFTLRKLSTNGIGVEKIFPVNLPAIKKVEIVKRGLVRRAKLYYLRNKIGKSAYKIKEKKLFNKTEKKA